MALLDFLKEKIEPLFVQKDTGGDLLTDYTKSRLQQQYPNIPKEQVITPRAPSTLAFFPKALTETMYGKTKKEQVTNLAVDAASSVGSLEFIGRAAKSMIPAAKIVAPKAFQGYDDLTTKFLDYSKGKTTLSKQEILDFARRPELKKGEADLLNKLVKDLPEGKLPAQEFAESIRRDLLELKPVKVQSPQYGNVNIEREIPDYRQYGADADAMAKAKLKGRNYEEVVFESPITTNGSSHYPNSKNYFAHARGDEVVESGKKIWREQEIQSDLLQKDNLAYLAEKERRGVEQQTRNISRDELLSPRQKAIMQMQGEKEITGTLQKLEPFTNDRFGERVMRERIRAKAQAGYEKYRLPTGKTIGKIEGFEPGGRWNFSTIDSKGVIIEGYNELKLENLKVGLEVFKDDTDWIVTDILGDGRFKAVPKSNYDTVTKQYGKDTARIADEFRQVAETFDLTGKSNPQYKRYENWGKFLKNKFGGKEVVDPQGNSWMEIDLKPEHKKMPIEAFGILPFTLLPPLFMDKKGNE